MSELKIQCPKCSNKIELTEQLAGPMLADLRATFDDELAKRETQATEALAAAMAQAKVAAKAETSAEQAALQDRLKAQDEKLRVAQAAQTAALKREEQLKDKEAEMELTLQKMLAAERPALAEKLAREADEKAGLKLAEQAQVMEGMKRQIEALKQKSEQGLRKPWPQRFRLMDLCRWPKGSAGRMYAKMLLGQTASLAVFCGKANARRTGQPVGLPSCAMIKGRQDVRLQ
jgi:hypothetical protein